jgi:hypothetical protein
MKKDNSRWGRWNVKSETDKHKTFTPCLNLTEPEMNAHNSKKLKWIDRDKHRFTALDEKKAIIW